jgi:stearoyl-CoA desaturase (delta-9 desaturase)
MSLLTHVLQPPIYGYEAHGQLLVPTYKQLFREFFARQNIFNTRKNWLALFGWSSSCLFAIPLIIFFTNYFSWTLLFYGFMYSMVILGTHGTVWYHRYSTHRAYTFSHPFWRFIVKNLVIKIIPEETYVVSHHVHHYISEKPGDPYNVHAGWWYCFLADVIHQPIAKDLSEQDYHRVCHMLSHTGIRMNRYDQYQQWGSVCHPIYTILHFSLNWAFWYAAFYGMGGHALATALFGSAGFWAFGVRTFNYAGHGSGKDKRKDGIDFHRADLSINQVWPGVITGEWHNNHHLYPNGARAGFLPYQFDPAWLFIWACSKIGAVRTFKDYKADFREKYYLPYLRKSVVERPPTGIVNSIKTEP